MGRMTAYKRHDKIHDPPLDARRLGHAAALGAARARSRPDMRG